MERKVTESKRGERENGGREDLAWEDSGHADDQVWGRWWKPETEAGWRTGSERERS